MVERKAHLDSLAISLLLACCLFWGLQQLLIKTTVGEVPPLWQAALRFVGATVLLSIWFVLRGVKSLALGERWSLGYSTYAWGSIAAQTIVGAFASYLTWMWLLRHYPATQMSSFTFLTPVFALVFGVALLQEPLTLQLVLALCGVA